MRLFFAVPLDAATRRAAGRMAHRARRAIEAEGVRVRWVAPALYHVTLAFLGEQPDATAESIARAGAEAAAAAAPFTATLADLALFPARGRPRVLAVACSPTEPFSALAGALSAALAPLGVIVPGGDLRPHVTLARAPRPEDGAGIRKALSGSARTAVTDGLTASYTVDSCSLMRSQPTRTGVHYEIVCRCPFES